MPSIAELSQPVVEVKTKKILDTVTTKQGLEDVIRSKKLVPLWNTGAPPAPPVPHSKQIPSVWHYADTKSLLLSAAALVDAREAERRAVLMINPGRNEPPLTLDTILAAHQLLLPGEKAICHRHTPFAVRFLIEGEKGYTAISGKKMYMAPGDLIITPSWNWHDHGNESDKNVIWLDGLNIPMFKPNPIDFVEHYDHEFGKDTHPSAPCADEDAAEMKFPFAKMQAKLEAQEGPYALSEYLLPNGQSISTTAGAFMERIDAGTSSAPRKETTEHIFQVHRGSGTTELVGLDGVTKTTLKWGPGDLFAIPSWYEFTNHADADSEGAYLFFFSNKPLLKNLGFWRSAKE